MTPDEEVRREIDKQLAACGWTVQDHKSMNLSAAPGIAVREFPLETGPVDYLLYAQIATTSPGSNSGASQTSPVSALAPRRIRRMRSTHQARVQDAQLGRLSMRCAGRHAEPHIVVGQEYGPAHVEFGGTR